MKPAPTCSPHLAAVFLVAGASVVTALMLWQARDAMEKTGEPHVDFQALHFQLGEFWLNTGNLDAAEGCFQRTLRNDAQAYGAHIALAKIEEQRGRQDQAIALLRQALELKPDDAEANVNLGNLLIARREFHAACSHYLKALATQPTERAALSNLALLKATCVDDSLRDGALAMELAARASRQLDDRDAWQLIVLAAAQAESGRFAEAVKTAEMAIEQAEKAGHSAMVETARQHLQLYRAGNPLRVSSY